MPREKSQPKRRVAAGEAASSSHSAAGAAAAAASSTRGSEIPVPEIDDSDVVFVSADAPSSKRAARPKSTPIARSPAMPAPRKLSQLLNEAAAAEGSQRLWPGDNPDLALNSDLDMDVDLDLDVVVQEPAMQIIADISVAPSNTYQPGDLISLPLNNLDAGRFAAGLRLCAVGEVPAVVEPQSGAVLARLPIPLKILRSLHLRLVATQPPRLVAALPQELRLRRGSGLTREWLYARLRRPAVLGQPLSIGDVLQTAMSHQTELPEASAPENLQLTMFPFQRHGLYWMLAREGAAPLPSTGNVSEITVPNPYYRTFEAFDTGIPVYVHYNAEHVTTTQPWLAVPPYTGILADEMGLGKTLEVVALVLAHPATAAGHAAVLAPLDEAGAVHGDGWQLPGAPLRRPRDDPSVTHLSCYCGDQRPSADNVIQCAECHSWEHVACSGFDPVAEARAAESWPSHCPPFVCSVCLARRDELPKVAATLVIVPDANVNQWQQEILKMCPELKTLVYPSGEPLRPALLKGVDMVVTCYSVLTKEKHHYDAVHWASRSRRFTRYKVRPSVLEMVQWWRICLDEVHKLDSAAISEKLVMAELLSARNKWCVTGTPMPRVVADLYPLLRFLIPALRDSVGVFEDMVMAPVAGEEASPFQQLLSVLMLRREHSLVSDELSLPRQTAKRSRLLLSSLERYFYDKALETSQQQYNQIVAYSAVEPDAAFTQLSKQQFSRIVQPVLQLRTACSHPGIAQGAGRQLLGQNQRISSTKEVMEALVSKVLQNCATASVDWSLACNGLAGLEILEGNLAQAFDYYQQTLSHQSDCQELYRQAAQVISKIVGTSSKLRRPDRFQLLHALHNIADVGQMIVDRSAAAGDTSLELPAGLNPQQLHEQVVDFRQRSLALRGELASHAQDMVAHEVADWEKLMRDYREESAMFFMDILAGPSHILPAKLLDVAKAACKTQGGKHDRPLLFSDMSTLKKALHDRTSELTECHAAITKQFRKLLPIPSADIVAFFASCPGCRSAEGYGVRSDNKLCRLCKLEGQLKEFDTFIFRNAWRDRVGTGDGEDGFKYLDFLAGDKDATLNRSDSQYVSVLRRLARTFPLGLDSVKAGVQNLELLQKEAFTFRRLWRHLYERISQLDELRWCTERLRRELLSDDLLLSGRQLLVDDMTAQRSSFVCTRATALASFRKEKGQLKYLLQVCEARELQYPVCQEVIGGEYSIFPCGHVLCSLDTQELVKRHHGSPPCPSCRERVPASQIKHVVVAVEDSDDQDDLSSKLRAMLRDLKQVKEQGERAVVFSHFAAVLKLASQAARDVGLNVATGPASKAIAQFQQRDDRDVLFLAIKKGGDGLNLTEANHVFLLEPALAPGVEAQAVSRIHRMGQRRPTFVHRYIMANTVEEVAEKLLNAMGGIISGMRGAEDMRSLTVADVRTLLGMQPVTDGSVSAAGAPAPSVWDRLVTFRGRPMKMDQVERKLSIAWSYQETGALQQRHVDFHGRRVNSRVAEQLQELLDGEGGHLFGHTTADGAAASGEAYNGEAALF